ncbi:MAG TPA: cytochrome c [Burkholderiales bacterium]|nr:cytochrome c [Burkholderiales bacterium]
MNNSKISMVLAVVLAGAWAMPAWSQARPEVLVKQRQAAMTLQGKYFYPIRAMAQGKTAYDANVVGRNVTYLDSLARMPWDGFTPATKDIKTQATPAVFSETPKFKESADRYQTEVTRLTELTRKGDEAAIRAQILAVDKSCNSCHETFRERQ